MDELVAYIRAESQQGVPAQEIRETLLGVGWSEFEVENALHDVAAGLHPVTQGASIHEDLAQVRGMLSHLATRVQRLETQLVGAPASYALPADSTPRISAGTQAALPEATVSSSQKVLTVFIGMVLAGLVGWFFASLAGDDGIISGGVLQAGVLVGAFIAVMGYRWMRARKTWAAELSVAAAVTLWTVAAWYAWRNGAMEGQNLGALLVLFLVLTLVMGRWIDRFARG